MAFTFASTSSTPTAAPSGAGGGFSFGAAPAPSTSSTGFTFGSSNPAPSSGSFTFGSGTTTPGTGGLTGGGMKSPGAGSGGLFSFSAPAAPAPATSSFSFGSTMGGTSGPTSTFSSAATASQPTAAAGVGRMTAHAPFSALPPHGQKIIHDIYNLLHQHNQTMASVSTMIPSALFTVTHSADQAAGIDNRMPISGGNTLLTSKVMHLHEMIKDLIHDIDRESYSVEKLLYESQELYKLCHQCAIYPVQNVARRRNIPLPSLTAASVGRNQADTGDSAAATGGDHVNKEPSVMDKLNRMLQENASQVDRLEGMPSLYLWRTIENLQERVENLHHRIFRIKKLLEGRKRLMQGVLDAGTGQLEYGAVSYDEYQMEELSLSMQIQVENLIRVAGIVAKLNERIEELKLGYKRYIARAAFQRGAPSFSLSQKSGQGMIGVGDGTLDGMTYSEHETTVFDPFVDADRKEIESQRRLEMEARKRAIEASKSIPTMSSLTSTSGTAPGPSSVGGLLGSSTASTAPSSGGFSFGSSAAPAPAPSGGGLFGSSTPAPAPASSGGFSFGGSATPAPAPSGGGLFGSSTPAPAPASSGGFSFGGSSTPAPATSGGGLFGSSTPAPTGGGLFGSTASSSSGTSGTPAPSTGGLFGSKPGSTPTSGGFSFGSTAAPAPAPAGGAFSFGSTAAPAPAGGAFSFGSTAAPAPAAGGLFGAAPASSATGPSSLKTRRKPGRRR